MNETLKGLLALLKDGDPSLKCASAQVLGALAPKNPQVVKTLVETLDGGDRYLVPFVLDALGSIQTDQALDGLVHYLQREDENSKEKAALALARAGAKGEEAVLRQWDRWDRESQKILVEVLFRTRGPLAVDKLCALLKTPEWARNAAFLKTLQERLPEFPPQQLSRLRSKLGGLFRSKLEKVPPSVLAAHLSLFSKIPGPSQVKTLLKFTGPAWPPLVRRTALDGLVGKEIPKEGVSTLLSYLRETDYTFVVAPALRVLKKIELPRTIQAKVMKLLDPGIELHPQIRSFLLEACGRFKNATAAKCLIRYLDNENGWARVRASKGLEKNPEARTFLQNRVLAATGEEEALLALRPLVSLKDSLKSPFLRKVFAHMEELRRAGNPTWVRLRAFFWEVDPGWFLKEGLGRAKELRRKGDFQAALDLLHTLLPGKKGRLDPQVRYEIGLTELLKAPKVPTEASQPDPAMGHFQTLLEDHGFDLLGRLKEEDQLKPDDFLYMGLHFLGRAPYLKEFALQALEYLMKRWPHSKASKLAHQKVRSVGIEKAP